MDSRCLVIDEWLFHYLGGEAGPEAIDQAIRLLMAIYTRCDRIAWQPGTPWAQKAFRLLSSRQPKSRLASKLLHRLLWDSAKSVIFTPRTSKMHVPWMDQIPEEDRYLAALYLEAEADALITTDEKLLSRIREAQAPIRAFSLQEWISLYFSGSQSR